MKPKAPALRYHGSKWKDAARIIRCFPPHLTYVEPYAGSAAPSSQYVFGMDETGHRELATQLQTIQRRAILCGRPSALYGGAGTEFLWLSPKLSAALSHMQLNLELTS